MKKSIFGFVTVLTGFFLFNIFFYSIVQAAVPSCNFTRDLSVGSNGADVLCLQQYLNSSGFTIASWGSGSLGNETNYFGTATEAAVIKWQIAKGISPASGYFGALSRAKFNDLNQVATGALPSSTNGQPLTPTAGVVGQQQTPQQLNTEIDSLTAKMLQDIYSDDKYEAIQNLNEYKFLEYTRDIANNSVKFLPFIGDIPASEYANATTLYNNIKADRNNVLLALTKAKKALKENNIKEATTLFVVAQQNYANLNGEEYIASMVDFMSIEAGTKILSAITSFVTNACDLGLDGGCSIISYIAQLASESATGEGQGQTLSDISTDIILKVLFSKVHISNAPFNGKTIDQAISTGIITAVNSQQVSTVLHELIDNPQLESEVQDSFARYAVPVGENVSGAALKDIVIKMQNSLKNIFPASTPTQLQTSISTSIFANSVPITANNTKVPSVSVPVTTNRTSSLIQAQINAIQQQIALLLKQAQDQRNNSTVTSSASVPNNQPFTQNTTPSQSSICVPSWNCGTWSACVNGQQTRTCTDLNPCGVTTGKPSQTQSCLASNFVQAPTVQSVSMPFSTLTSALGGVNYGTGTTLRWSSLNATGCTASGGWSGAKALSGSQDTGPLYSTQTFILTCTGSGGSVSQQTSVSVSPPSTVATSVSSPTLTFSTASGWVKYGQETTLQWSSSNAASCVASGGWSGNEPLSGSKNTGPLYSTETFVLTCTGTGGAVSRSVSIGIQNAPTLAIVDSYAATQGKTFNLSGSNFASNGGVTLHFSKPDGSFYPDQHAQADSYGKLSYSWPVPADATPGNSSVSATDDTGGLQTSSIGFKIIAAAQLTGDLTLSVSPASGPIGTTFTVSGTNFTPNSAVIVRFQKPDTDQYANQYQATQPAADSNGNLILNWTGSGWSLPDSIKLGTVSIWALDNATGRRSPSVSIQITAQ